MKWALKKEFTCVHIKTIFTIRRTCTWCGFFPLKIKCQCCIVISPTSYFPPEIFLHRSIFSPEKWLRFIVDISLLSSGYVHVVDPPPPPQFIARWPHRITCYNWSVQFLLSIPVTFTADHFHPFFGLPRVNQNCLFHYPWSRGFLC